MGKNASVGLERQAELERVRRLGKHVTREKGAVLLAGTLAVCALPMVLGLRLWEHIPETVATGLTGPDGQDDSLPRAAVVFLLPGLMCLLNLITHAQLLLNQRRMTLPKPHIRLMGRFGFPILSLGVCSYVTLRAAGTGGSPLFWTQCVLGLALMLLGAHLWDGPASGRRWAGRFLLGLGFLAAAWAVLTAGLPAGR